MMEDLQALLTDSDSTDAKRIGDIKIDMEVTQAAIDEASDQESLAILPILPALPSDPETHKSYEVFDSDKESNDLWKEHKRDASGKVLARPKGNTTKAFSYTAADGTTRHVVPSRKHFEKLKNTPSLKAQLADVSYDDILAQEASYALLDGVSQEEQAIVMDAVERRDRGRRWRMPAL